ncbi:hypothetical protein BGZ99_009611, partial [Dissophora globulifera]
MLRTIKEYYCTEQDEDYDWVYDNARDGRDLETTLASSPNVSPGPSKVTIFLPVEEASVPSPELIQTADGDDVVDRP